MGETRERRGGGERTQRAVQADDRRCARRRTVGRPSREWCEGDSSSPVRGRPTEHSEGEPLRKQERDDARLRWCSGVGGEALTMLGFHDSGPVNRSPDEPTAVSCAQLSLARPLDGGGQPATVVQDATSQQPSDGGKAERAKREAAPGKE